MNSNDIITELRNRGYDARLDGTLVALDLNPDLGHSRSYTIEYDGKSGDWQVYLSEVIYDDDGEENEEQSNIGDYASAKDIADAIEEHEGEY